MTVKNAKPTSPGRRFVTKVKPDNLHKGKPYAGLVVSKNRNGGRNADGRITTRHHGGGTKQHYRLIDFKRNKDDIPARVERLEYDPNRSAIIALVVYKDGERRYMIAPKGLKAGMTVTSGHHVAIRTGNALPIRNIPVGSIVHCVEMKPGKGAQMARSAGTSVQIVGKDNVYATLRLRSGEVRRALLDCRAVIGEVSNPEHSLRTLGKAGASRWRGNRPTVRGVSMNPIDHPHGGGEGRTAGGRHPVSPWGTPTKGYKTRHSKRSSHLIISRRKSKK